LLAGPLDVGAHRTGFDRQLRGTARVGETASTARKRASKGIDMFRIALGLVIGYILGSKAGRERYEQIVRLGSKIADNPAVQGAAGFVRAKVSGLLSGRKRTPARPDAAYLDAESPITPAPTLRAAG
jgi:hypothetical protein